MAETLDDTQTQAPPLFVPGTILYDNERKDLAGLLSWRPDKHRMLVVAEDGTHKVVEENDFVNKYTQLGVLPNLSNILDREIRTPDQLDYVIEESRQVLQEIRQAQRAQQSFEEFHSKDSLQDAVTTLREQYNTEKTDRQAAEAPPAEVIDDDDPDKQDLPVFTFNKGVQTAAMTVPRDKINNCFMALRVFQGTTTLDAINTEDKGYPGRTRPSHVVYDGATKDLGQDVAKALELYETEFSGGYVRNLVTGKAKEKRQVEFINSLNCAKLLASMYPGAERGEIPELVAEMSDKKGCACFRFRDGTLAFVTIERLPIERQFFGGTIGGEDHVTEHGKKRETLVRESRSLQQFMGVNREASKAEEKAIRDAQKEAAKSSKKNFNRERN